MINFKYLFILFFIFINLNASMQKDIVYVENLDSKESSLKDEFFKHKTKLYTISIGTLTLERHDPIDFFKTYNMTNALAYKYGEKKEFARVISGVYETGKEASEGIKNLDPRLQKNKPYVAKLMRHQQLYKENSNLIKNTVTEKKKNVKYINEAKNSIYVTNKEESIKLKKEFLNPKSKYYSIAIGSISLDNNTIENFFNTYDIGNNALAHVYGKNKNKARIIYGLYETAEEAKMALESLNSNLQSNSPYALKMKRFQKFYEKYYPNSLNNKMIVELKIDKKENNEKSLEPKLSDEIKIIEKEEKAKIKEVQKKILPPKLEKKKKKKEKEKVKIKEIVKKEKKINKKNSNEDKFIKNSKLEDVYYIESDGNFNILSEVFLNDKSSFYTIDLGELKLKEISIEEFFIKNSMNNNALAYKYGKNKDYARVVYGAYENKDDAKNAIENINFTDAKDLRVTNIKKHQNLYKEFHKINKKIVNKKKRVYKQNINYNETVYDDKITLIKDENNYNVLEEEFFNRDSRFYTITLITFLKKDMLPEEFFSMYNLGNNVLAYPIGTVNNYYRLIYGLYKSSEEAKNAIRELPYNLRKNLPYISRIKTNQKKFESYNNRNLESEIERIEKIQLN